jgi:hypothetical protein
MGKPCGSVPVKLFLHAAWGFEKGFLNEPHLQKLGFRPGCIQPGAARLRCRAGELVLIQNSKPHVPGSFGRMGF